MAFTKITTSELNSRGATTLPNQPKISATALKQEFDAPAKEVVAPKFNNLIDELEGESAAASVGAIAPTGRTGNTVQAVMNKLSVDLKTVEDGMSEAIADAHTHANKDLLDTYTQTEEDIAQAIADDHTHANKDLLDTYEQTESDLADAVANTHSHSNKSVLDKFDEEDGVPTYDGNPIGGGEGDMLASDYDPNDTVKNAGGIVDYVDSQAYELPTAAADTKGGIKVGTNLSVDSNGVMSATDTTYSDATTSQSGLMSATDKTKLDGIEANANNYSLPTASTSTLGGVKVDGTSVTIDANGVISAQGGSGDAYKTVKVGASNIVASGEDTLELVAGSNVTLTPDTSLKKVTISASGGGGSTGDMLVADYDSDFGVKTAGGIKSYVAGLDYVAKSSTAGLLKNDGTVDQTQYVSDISGKTDKVTGAVSGNFAALTITGNLTDSGKKASDFLGATDIEANPSGSATGSLSKLRIGSSIYSIEGGGGTTIVQIPSVSGTSFTYDGTAQGAAITGLDTTHCTVVAGTGTTVTTVGDTTYVKATNAGSYSFSVELNDTSSMVWSDLTIADKTYSFTIAKAPQTITASKNSVSLTAQQLSDTVTISGQQGSLNVSSSDTGVATVSESSGVVTITAVDDGNATVSVYAESSANYEQSNTVNISVAVALVPSIYGVSWDGTSTSAWTRTDNAALFTDPVPAVNNGNGSSPFDSIAPWSGMVISERTGGTMVAIPKFYFKLTKSGSAMSLKITAGENASWALANGYKISPAHRDRGDGVGERDTVYVGRYHCASDYKSKTGVAPKTNATIATFRSNISALGSNIWQWDYAVWETIQLLYLVEFADWNSQSKIGYGGSSSGNYPLVKSGSTDNMQYCTGTNASSLTTYGNVQYRNIEDLWSNGMDFVDGIRFDSSNKIYIIDDPSDFSSSSGGTEVGTRLTTGGFISAYDISSASGYEWFLYPSAVSGTDSTYVCDVYEINSSSNNIIRVGGDYGKDFYTGLFRQGARDDSINGAGLTARIMELP